MEILRYKSGKSNIYFIKSATGWMIIDAGMKKNPSGLYHFIKNSKITPCKVKLIIITHVHYDHLRLLDYLKFITSAPIFVHESEADLLENGIMELPKARKWYASVATSAGRFFRSAINFKSVKADYTIKKSYDLRSWGFQADIIHTPGHTKGSISVVFESGEAFIGDTCINSFGKTVIPPFYNDGEMLLESMEKLNASGAVMFYPGHGKSFKIDKLHRSISKLNKKN